MNNMIDFYNEEAHTKSSIEDITFDPTRISWTETLQKMAIESSVPIKRKALRIADKVQIWNNVCHIDTEPFIAAQAYCHIL